jgi:hypothetical protein
MWRLLFVVTLCIVGLTACGVKDESNATLESKRQGLACETGTGSCPGDTTCAYFPDNPDEGLCRPRCINGTCSGTQICCTQPYGAPYCNGVCF